MSEAELYIQACLRAKFAQERCRELYDRGADILSRDMMTARTASIVAITEVGRRIASMSPEVWSEVCAIRDALDAWERIDVC